MGCVEFRRTSERVSQRCTFSGRRDSPAAQDLGAIVDVCGVQRREKGRRISAFNYFVKHMVPIVRKENPGMVHQMYMKKVAQVCTHVCKCKVIFTTSQLASAGVFVSDDSRSHFLCRCTRSCSLSRSYATFFIFHIRHGKILRRLKRQCGAKTRSCLRVPKKAGLHAYCSYMHES